MRAAKKDAMKQTNASQSAQLRPIGVIRSRLKQRSKAPKQGSEGAPDVWLDVRPFAAKALSGLAVADEIIILTWFTPSSPRHTKSPSALRSKTAAYRCVHDPVSRPAEPDRPSSSHCAEDRQKPFANRSHGSHR